MKIDLARKGTKMQLSVTVAVPFYDTRVFTLDWECGSDKEVYAGLLVQLFRDQLFKRVQAIRREAYEQGWNDHKKRRPHEEYFSGCINE